MSFHYIPDGQVKVPEIPYQNNIMLPGSKTALIIVDMQNDFVLSDGSLVVPAAADTINNIKKLMELSFTNPTVHTEAIKCIHMTCS